MNAQVEVYTIEIQSLSDYEYLAQKVKDYHYAEDGYGI